MPPGDEAMKPVRNTSHRVQVMFFAMLMTLCYIISPSISHALPRTSQEHKQMVIEFCAMVFEKK